MQGHRALRKVPTVWRERRTKWKKVLGRAPGWFPWRSHTPKFRVNQAPQCWPAGWLSKGFARREFPSVGTASKQYTFFYTQIWTAVRSIEQGAIAVKQRAANLSLNAFQFWIKSASRFLLKVHLDFDAKRHPIFVVIVIQNGHPKCVEFCMQVVFLFASHFVAFSDVSESVLLCNFHYSSF